MNVLASGQVQVHDIWQVNHSTSSHMASEYQVSTRTLSYIIGMGDLSVIQVKLEEQ